jgi:hypothetical protein
MRSLEKDEMAGDMLKHLSGPVEAMPNCEKQAEGN